MYVLCFIFPPYSYRKYIITPPLPKSFTLACPLNRYFTISKMLSIRKAKKTAEKYLQNVGVLKQLF